MPTYQAITSNECISEDSLLAAEGLFIEMAVVYLLNRCEAGASPECPDHPPQDESVPAALQATTDNS